MVTSDLAIAKIAMQVQAEESLKYDKVFFAMGSFHVELTGNVCSNWKVHCQIWSGTFAK